MGVNQTNSNSITVDGEEIEDVQQFTSLGSVVNKVGSTDQDITARIGKATAAFKALNPIWRSQGISAQIMICIFNTNVKTVLLYACETWRTITSSIHKLQSFSNRCLRQTLHIKWQDRVTHKELWGRADQELMEVQIRGRKWGWLRHTLRKPPSRIVRHYLRWNQQGKRKRRRPRTTRRRSTEAEAQSRGYTWGRLETTTRDRE